MLKKMIRTKDDLKFPEFDDIKVSTKTYTATTNLNIQIKDLYDKLPITQLLQKGGGKRKQITLIQTQTLKKVLLLLLNLKDNLGVWNLNQKLNKQINKNGLETPLP